MGFCASHYFARPASTILLLVLLVIFSVFSSFYEISKFTLHKKRLSFSSRIVPTTIETFPESSSCNPCPPYPPHLKKHLKINPNITLEETEKSFGSSVKPGGFSSPKECKARWRVALIIPFRKRESQIGPFLNHMYPFLQRQQVNVSVYFVNQTDSKPFNRARLLNVGFVESLPDGPFDCFIFHDIDLLPEDDRHLYHCSSMPRHLNVAASNTGYKYSMYFGGACSMTERHFRMVNGWSNKYWGWGGEDDDMRRRIALRKLHVWRYPKEIARYTMLPHERSEINPHRYEDLKENIHLFKEDGLNSLQYNLITIERKPLFTSINVDFSQYF